MSDVDIRSGGTVAVDTATLRAAAERVRALAPLASAAGEAARRVRELSFAVFPHGGRFEVATSTLVSGTGVLVADVAYLADALENTAAAYELVELRAERALAETSGDHGRVAEIDVSIDGLRARWPAASDIADASELAATGHSDEVWRQLSAWGVPIVGLTGALGIGALALVLGARGALRGADAPGRVTRGARLGGSVPAVTLLPQPVGAATGRPAGLADLYARVPTGEARVRIERYTMSDGSRAYAAYIAGTDGSSTWDNTANLALYRGDASTSSAAVAQALEAAGAQRGDTVQVTGYSQGAMVAAHLAASGEYDVPVLATFGSPVAVDVDPATLVVDVRHDDDPIAALAAPPSAAAPGADGGVTIGRVVDPATGPHDVTMPAHDGGAYLETARRADASGDPRLAALEQRLAVYDAAVSVETFAYSAEAVPTPAPTPTPGLDPSLQRPLGSRTGGDVSGGGAG